MSDPSPDDERCWLSHHETLKCHTQRDKESGELRNSCERVKQTIRHCLGRPDEVIENVQEHLEQPVQPHGIPEALASTGLSLLGALQRGLFGEQAEETAPEERQTVQPPLTWRETMELADRLQAAANEFYEQRGATKRSGRGGGTREV
jgi:hypothetical protein